MGGSKGGGDSTVTNKSEPAPEVRPYLSQAGQVGFDLANRPVPVYTGQRLAGIPGETEAGLRMTANRALQGSPVMNMAQGNLAATLGGAFMMPETNPYLSANVNTALRDVQGRIGSQFNNNAFGSSAHQEVLGRAMGETAMKAYGDNYRAERDNQIRGMLFAPQMAAADYQDAQSLLGVGDARRQLEQEALNNQRGLWEEMAMSPYAQQDIRLKTLSALQGGYGGSTMQTSPMPKSSPIAGALGGGLSGAAAGYSLAPLLGMTGPWGAAAGLALGALGGGLV